MGGAPPVGVRGTLATTPSPSKVTIEFVDGCVGRYSPPSHLIKLRKRREWSRVMDRSPRPLLDLATFVLLMFAVAVGGVVTDLTQSSGVDLPQSLLAGGAAAGAALLWARSVLGPGT